MMQLNNKDPRGWTKEKVQLIAMHELAHDPKFKFPSYPILKDKKEERKKNFMKHVIFMALLAVAIAVSGAINLALEPEVTTSLALEQFTNPSVEASTSQRVAQNGFRLLSALPYCLWAVTGFFMYRKDFFKGKKTNEQSN